MRVDEVGSLHLLAMKQKEVQFMTLEKMKEIMDRNGVPGNVRLMRHSGWELGATDMDGILWNPEKNVIHFVQMAALEADGIDGYDEKWIVLK